MTIASTRSTASLGFVIVAPNKRVLGKSSSVFVLPSKRPKETSEHAESFRFEMHIPRSHFLA